MYEKIKALLVDELQINEDDITPSAELVSDLGINSLELADLVLLCEEKFNIESATAKSANSSPLATLRNTLRKLPANPSKYKQKRMKTYRIRSGAFFD